MIAVYMIWGILEIFSHGEEGELEKDWIEGSLMSHGHSYTPMQHSRINTIITLIIGSYVWIQTIFLTIRWEEIMHRSSVLRQDDCGKKALMILFLMLGQM